MITIKDIAKEAGVSPTTVSRVINHVPSKVSEEKRKQILALIEKYKYVPNPSARSLSANSSNIIAILLNPDCRIGKTGYYPEMLRLLIGSIQAAGYLPTIYYAEDEQSTLNTLKTWNVDGAVLLSDFGERSVFYASQDAFPIVFIDSYHNPRMSSNISADDYKSGILAADYFIRKGCTAFYFVYSDAISLEAQEQRLSGLKDSIADKEACNIRQLSGNALNNKRDIPDGSAVFVNDIASAQKISLEYAHRLELVCFDFWQPADYPAHISALISQRIENKAKSAVDILLHHITEDHYISQKLVMDVYLNICD